MFYLAIFALNVLGLSPVALTENILLLRIFSQCSLRLFITAGMDCLIWPQPELEGKQPGKGKIWKGANTIAIHQFQSIPNSSCGVWHMTIWRRSDMGSPIKKKIERWFWPVLWKRTLLLFLFCLIQKLVKAWFYLTLQPIQLYVSQVCILLTHICIPVHSGFPEASTSWFFRHFWHH